MSPATTPAALALPVFAILLGSCSTGKQLVEAAAMGDAEQLRSRDQAAPRSSDRPPVVIVALDGVPRSLLYSGLRRGELPGFDRLLGGRRGDRFPHAHLDESMISALPSSTITGWSTLFTGRVPAEHGMVGNEFFDRRTGEYFTGVPTTFRAADQVIRWFTDHYVSKRVAVPTLYERLRERDPHAQIWVALHFLFRGADKLIFIDRMAMLGAVEALARDTTAELVANEAPREAYAAVDESITEELADELSDSDVTPGVITLYLPGADMYAHVARGDTYKAMADYLRQVTDAQAERLAEALAERGLLDRAFVVVVADHGHSPVPFDARHALAAGREDDPPSWLREAGFSPRPARHGVDGAWFDSVLSYQGGMAFAYVANRSTRAEGNYDWSAEPRYRQDVLAMAEVFHQARRRTGALELILVRRPDRSERSVAVYLGNGKTAELGPYLRQHCPAEWIDLEARLRALTEGEYGYRAGDVILIATHDVDPDHRFYFSHGYRSHHGSPARADSEIPFIVANRSMNADRLRATVESVTRGRGEQHRIADVILRLRLGSFDQTKDVGVGGFEAR